MRASGSIVTHYEYSIAKGVPCVPRIVRQEQFLSQLLGSGMRRVLPDRRQDVAQIDGRPRRVHLRETMLELVPNVLTAVDQGR